MIVSLILTAVSAHAAAIQHAFVEQNTNQTTTSSTFVDISGASIASGSFTTGKKYLLFATAQCSDEGNRVDLQALHGSTAFADSLVQLFTNKRVVYQWMTVWTAVSSEGVKLQFRNADGVTAVACDQIALFAMNLSDDLTENTDWVFAERTTDDALSTTFLDGASITFTPGTAGHTWLVIPYSRVDITVHDDATFSRLSRSGEATSTTPEAQWDEVGTDGFVTFLLPRCFTLGAASNTFKEQAASGATSQTRLYSSIFALNLHKFRNRACAYTDADIALATTTYATELATITLSPDVAGNVLIGSYFGADRNTGTVEFRYRIQVDNADQPAGQSTDVYEFRAGAAGNAEDPLPMITLTSLTAAPHTIDLDASVDSTTGAPTAQHRLLWAVTMELAAAAGGGPPKGALCLVGLC